jgi:predicted phage terminase large subunit-like protein
VSDDRALLEARARARIELASRREPLIDFIPRVSPHLEPPNHLAPYIEVLELAQREPIKVVVAAPPQHSKTETTKHAIVRYLLRQPHRRNAYISYNFTRAEAVSLETQWIAGAAGLSFSGTRERWYTPQGGGLLATGIGGGLTGYGIDGVMVVDDPFKNREEAESPVIREHHEQWFTSTAISRLHPGASVVVMATRWHPDDLSGRLIAKGWRFINLPAISDGKALWESKRPFVWLEEQRKEIGEYDWNALYMGAPRNRGDSVFRDPTYYSALPKSFRVSIGADFAYSTKSYADYSVIVVLAHDPATKITYVLDVYRKQVEAPEFQKEILERQTKFGGAAVTAFIGGTEKGIVDFMKRAGVKVNALPASADKFTRCQPVAAAWNDGKVQVPMGSPPWLAPFLSEVVSFTGVKDRHDDQPDALAGAFQPFAIPPAPRGVGTRSVGMF